MCLCVCSTHLHSFKMNENYRQPKIVESLCADEEASSGDIEP